MCRQHCRALALASLVQLIIVPINQCDAFVPSPRLLNGPVQVVFKSQGPGAQPWCTGGSNKELVPTTQLQASPTAITAGIVASHVIGGTLGTPVVIRAIKTWYSKIDLPPWTPPNFLFAPVWTTLYAIMGFAVARVVVAAAKVPWYKQTSLQVWVAHYTLNILWAPVFFGLKRFRLAAIMNFGLLATLATTVCKWWAETHKLSVYLMIPYALWLTFATALNVEICRRNPEPYNSARFVEDLDRLQQDAAKKAGL